MDRLQKALDLARAERGRKAVPVLAPAKFVPLNVQDTAVVSRTRTVPVDAVVLRANGVMQADAGGAAGQAFKMLRTRVLQKMRQRGWNTLAVVSATPKDGKTFTAINLAIAIAAETAHTTLLVDLDLHNPSVHRRFGIEPKVGVEQCLRVIKSRQRGRRRGERAGSLRQDYELRSSRRAFASLRSTVSKPSVNQL